MAAEVIKRAKKFILGMLPEEINLLHKFFIDIRLNGKPEKNLVKTGNEKPCIVFILQFPETWNSLQSILEASKEKNLNCYILCIPKPISNKDENLGVNHKINEAYEFCLQQKLDSVIKADNDDGTFYDIDGLKPDYIFCCRPYNQHLPEQYKSENLSKKAKLCYVPYAYSMIDGKMFWTTFNRQFIRNVTFTFVPSKSRLELCKKEYYWYTKFGINHFEYLGFPRFDRASNNQKLGKDFTVAWLPRWKTGTGTEGQKFSHFLDYYKNFLEFANEHPDIKLIIRPHPLMFENFVEKGIMTKLEVDAIKDEWQKTPNIILDTNKDYFPMITETDVLVADYTSLLMEFFVTGKPIIYCDNAENFSNEARIMDQTIYHAESWSDIMNRLVKLESGSDELEKERKEAISRIIPKNTGSIGEAIIDYLINDFKGVMQYGKK